MDFQDILFDVSDGIATITLNRPDKLNAFTGRMMYEIIAALDITDADDDVKVVIFTGAGRAFCAGADLSSGGDTFAKGGSDVQTKQGVINGPAVGVGVTMTLPMDFRLASDTAKFGFVFAKRGIVPEACSSYFLPRLVGISQATEWVFTGRVFPASEALAGGLVRSVHAPDDLMAAAIAIAREIADNTAPVSVAMSRKMLWHMLGASHPMEAHRADSRGIQQRGRSADSKEGVVSFLEKRPAVYPDKVSGGLPDIFPGWEEPEFF
jgi:enoyl-CoA hydratase/carnithine racemase